MILQTSFLALLTFKTADGRLVSLRLISCLLASAEPLEIQAWVLTVNTKQVAQRWR